MINLSLYCILSILFINVNWIDHKHFVQYIIGHAISLSLCVICLIILLIKLCFYKNKEVISLKDQSRFSSFIRCMIVVLYFGFLFTGAYVNVEGLVVKEKDNANIKE